jgi:hypothetical protein
MTAEHIEALILIVVGASVFFWVGVYFGKKATMDEVKAYTRKGWKLK